MPSPTSLFSTRSDYYRKRNPRHAPTAVETLAIIGGFSLYLAFGAILSALFFPA